MQSARMPALELVKKSLRRRWRVIVLGLFSLVVVDLLQLTIPRVVKYAVDDLAIGQAGVSLGRYGMILVALGVAIAGFRYCWRRCLLGSARYVEEALRNRLFSHLQAMSPAFFDTVSTGETMAWATNDIQQVRMAIGMGLVALNDALFLGVAAIGFMAYIDLKLTFYVMLPMPFIVISSRFLGRRMHRGYQKVQGAFGTMTENIRQHLAAIRLIKAHGLYCQAAGSVAGTSSNYVQENMKLVKVAGFFFPLMLLFTNLSLALVLWLGGRMTILGRITPGDFVAFLQYLGLMTWPMMAMGWVVNLVQRGKASLDRLDRIMGTEPDVRSPDRPLSPPKCRGRIVFDGVKFGYHSRLRSPAVAGIDFMVEPGQVLGLVGPPGSGKTTVLSLLMRHYDVDEGRIMIDEADVRHLDLEWIRRTVAWVGQEPFIFAGTIRENLTLGRRVSKSRLKQVLEDAALADNVSRMPRGLDSLVGEKGVILSGGQKQRVALARALLKDAPVLLLDDPVSQVDASTSHRLIQTLKNLARRKTMIIASHRAAAVSFADRIICLDKGKITAAGTHDQLVRAGGYYRRMIILQESEDAL